MDVETRWSSTFTMVKNAYELRDIFMSVMNDSEFKHVFNEREILDDEWKKHKLVSEFLSD